MSEKNDLRQKLQQDVEASLKDLAAWREIMERLHTVEEDADNAATDHSTLFNRVAALEARADSFDGTAYKVDSLEAGRLSLIERITATEKLLKALLEAQHSHANTLQVLLLATGIGEAQEGADLPAAGEGAELLPGDPCDETCTHPHAPKKAS